MATQDELKAKYQGAIDALTHFGYTPEVSQDGDKLKIKANVTSDVVKTRVWDEIKAADASFADLTVEVTSDGPNDSYEVKSGDNLSHISKFFYGTPNKYQKIADANGLDNPDHIKVGQTLVIPA